MEYLSRIIALTLLIILLPLIVIIIFFSLIFQGSPVIFSHKRIGYKFERFNLYKFRTMKNLNSNQHITSPNDQRITQWGKYLRFAKIDEIPQLVNIVYGHMRFVGPRPEVEKYVNSNAFFFMNDIKPGITDLSSIFFRNENKIINKIGGVKNYHMLLNYKIELCKIYAKKKSFNFDLSIVFLTLISIVMPKFSQNQIMKIIINENKISLSNDLKKFIL